MPKLAIIVKEVRKFAADQGISDEDFLNAFLSAFVIAGDICNKNGEEFHLDKAATSLLLNQKSDVPQKLRKALLKYGIKEKTEEGMQDFIEDYLNSGLIPELVQRLQILISGDVAINGEERKRLTALPLDAVSILLADLLMISFSDNNRPEPQRTVIWKNGANAAEVITGDLFRFGFDNRSKRQKNIVVIPVNTAFDTHVTRKLEGDSKPIVSENTIHGQWLKRMEQSGTDMKQLDERISSSLKNLGYTPVASDKNRNGKTDRYAIGSCALIETENASYILVAISEFDEMNNAKSDPEIIDTALRSLLKTYDTVGQGYNLYMPLMGTGRSRAGLSINGAYHLLKNSIINNAQLIQGHIYLVLRQEDRPEIEEEES